MREGDPPSARGRAADAAVLPPEDIVARIGGDEFVALTRSGAADTITMIEKRLARRFTDYNAASTKPYQVACSFGGYLVNADSN